MSPETRFDRNERFFGADGQSSISGTRVVVVGCGGIGSIFTQQAAYLGVRSFGLIDGDVVTESSMNRLVGAEPSDVDRTLKVEVARRLVCRVDPAAEVAIVAGWLDEATARELITAADVVIGCLDDDYARLQLTAIAAEARLHYFDLATDISDDGGNYGGRVVCAVPGRRCVYCLGELDPEELARGGLTPEQRAARDRIYGIRKTALDARGASVVSLNGVVASLALTEFMVYVTGIRAPAIALTYRGDLGTVRKRSEEPTGPCPYCGRG